MVIRRLGQHYQNLCGFESIEKVQAYLGVFKKVYRFTPLSDDARRRSEARVRCNWPGTTQAECR